MGRAGRRYAERTFSPETAADQFLGVFGDLVPRRSRFAATSDAAAASRAGPTSRLASIGEAS